MAHEITGKIMFIGDTTQITEKFAKREIIVETRDNPNYPERIILEAHQDRCDLLDAWNVNDDVKVHFNIKGRTAGDGRTFNTLQAWRFEKVN